jgi:hypothetical protein
MDSYPWDTYPLDPYPVDKTGKTVDTFLSINDASCGENRITFQSINCRSYMNTQYMVVFPVDTHICCFSIFYPDL